MESTVTELINSLNQTIDKLIKENQELKEKILSFKSDEFPIGLTKSEVPNQILSQDKLETLANINESAFNHADYIIKKALDLTFLIKNEIKDLLNKISEYKNYPTKMLDAILEFVHKNNSLLSYGATDKEELVQKIKTQIKNKLSGR